MKLGGRGTSIRPIRLLSLQRSVNNGPFLDPSSTLRRHRGLRLAGHQPGTRGFCPDERGLSRPSESTAGRARRGGHALSLPAAWVRPRVSPRDCAPPAAGAAGRPAVFGGRGGGGHLIARGGRSAQRRPAGCAGGLSEAWPRVQAPVTHSSACDSLAASGVLLSLTGMAARLENLSAFP